MSAPARSVRYFLYRPEVLSCRDDELRPVDWEADANLSALIWLAVRLLGGSKKPDVYWLPVPVSHPGGTHFERALVLRAGGPTAFLSPVRLSTLRRFFVWSITLRPTDAVGLGGFAEHVASEAREAAGTFTAATCAPGE